MTRKLQYVVHRRQNITLAVGIVAILSANPKENHMMVVKRILKYLKGVEDYGLYYKRNNKCKLNIFIDSNWAGNIDDRKSISGGAFFLGKRLVSWIRKKQNCISQSIVEAEYVATAVNYSNIMWINQLLKV
jgi:hypothetical protein